MSLARIISKLFKPAVAAGYSRPQFSIPSMTKRLNILMKKLNSAEKMLKNLDPAVKAKDPIQISYNKISYEIDAIIAKLNQLESEGIPSPDVNDLSSKVPDIRYRMDLASIDRAIKAFHTIKKSKHFSAESQEIFSHAIMSLQDFKNMRTYKHYDKIIVGTVVLVMMTEDKIFGPQPRYDKKLLYPVALDPQANENLMTISTKILSHELPFDGILNNAVFAPLVPIFPNYLKKEYNLTATAADMNTTVRSANFYSAEAKRALMRSFTVDYEAAYELEIFKNPFSTMLKLLRTPGFAYDDLLTYVKNNPNSRSARLLRTIQEQGSQRPLIKQFAKIYQTQYQQTFFHNPFSFMRLHISKIISTEQICNHVIAHPHARSAKALKILNETVTVKDFLRPKT